VPFHHDYVRLVLERNFEDAKAQFLEPLMAIHYAHLVMLAERGIVSAAEAVAIRGGLDAIGVDEVRCARYDGSCEDLYFHVERLLVQACGEDAAGRLHTARSRNDIDMTMYRMLQREMILDLAAAVLRLRGVLMEQAGRHGETVFAAHTHTQPAQASTVAHYLLAVIEQLERDSGRLQSAYAATNLNPLGACAITGTGFPIDRARTTELLGFDDATGNTYGSIATVDYLLQSVSAAAVLLTGLGRVVQDLLLWCTAEFAYLRLADGFVQTSSIMPQKRNPVALEHARALSSMAVGQTTAILIGVHNTPFGDIVDSEDDLQPLVCSMFEHATRAVTLVAAAMEGARFDVARMAARARLGWITVTELADTLARDQDMAFTTAHHVAARFVAESALRPNDAHRAILGDITAAVLGRRVEYTDDRLREVLSPEYFVKVRMTPGGPAPTETARALSVSRAKHADDGRWLSTVRASLQGAEASRKAAAEKLG
jgi:argininosuccinate lyase